MRDSEPITAVDVEKFVGRWIAAWLSGNVDDFVSLAGAPFFLNEKIVLTKADLRTQFAAIATRKGDDWKKLEVRLIKVQTVAEIQSSGYDLSKDRIFRSLNLSLNDFAVLMLFAKDNKADYGITVVVRRLGNSLEVAGMWE